MNNHKALGVVLSTTLLLVFLFLSGTTLASPQLIMAESQAAQAFEYAMQYVDNEVAYLFGGRYSVEDYQVALADGKEPGYDIGVDSSAVVINSYRDVIPEIRFWVEEQGRQQYRDVSSSALYHWNHRPLSVGEVSPGDLVFFQNESKDIIGVGIFSHLQGEVVHFLVASANAGQVILTNARMNGDYWQNSFAGFGRLRYTIAP